MMTSTFLVPAASALLGALMYRHHRQVFAWTRRMRRKDETNTEYDKPSAWLADLYAAQCGLAQKPCAAEDFKDIATIGNMLAGIADHTEGVRFELTRVVESVRGYVATALPGQGRPYASASRSTAPGSNRRCARRPPATNWRTPSSRPSSGSRTCATADRPSLPVHVHLMPEPVYFPEIRA